MIEPLLSITNENGKDISTLKDKNCLNFKVRWYTKSEFKSLLAVIGFYSSTMIFLQNGFKLYKTVLPKAFQEMKLSRSDFLQWNSRVVSSLNAIVLVTTGLNILSDKRFIEDPVFHATEKSFNIIPTFCGYIVYDLLLMLFHSKHFTDLSAYFHHTLFLIIITGLGLMPFFHGAAVSMTLHEISTVFINFAWFLNKYTSNTNYQVPSYFVLGNAFIGFSTFLFFRIIFNFYMEKKTIETLKGSTNYPGFVNLILVPQTIICSLNLYWFHTLSVKVIDMITTMNHKIKP